MTDATGGGAGRGIPLSVELLELVRPAQVCFAVRCAMRVQRLFAYEVRRDERAAERAEEWIAEVDHAIALARRACEAPPGARPSAEELLDTAHANEAYFASNEELLRGTATAARFARTVAANGAVDAASASHNAEAAASGSAGSPEARAAARSLANAAARRDLELLLALQRDAEAEGAPWTHDTVVPVALLGPLWPEGEPEGWSEEAKEERAGEETFEVEIEVPEGASEEEIERRITEFMLAANRLRVAQGGHGLEIDMIELPAHERKPGKVLQGPGPESMSSNCVSGRSSRMSPSG